MKRMPTIAVFGAALVAASAPAGLARGDGLPVEGIDVGQKGVVDSTRDARYVTLSAGGDTVLERVARRGGRVDASTQIDGAFTIPAVAYDATPAGLFGRRPHSSPHPPASEVSARNDAACHRRR